MSEVKRYRLDPESYAAEHPQGDLVDYQDYARLKAEVERLRAASFVTAVPVEQYKRVVKAGDALYESKIGYYGEQILENMKHHSGELCRNWNAAKEGKPSV